MASIGRFTITWLGHSTFLLGTPGGTRLIFDPWLVDNPRCPDEWKRKVPAVDLVFVSHGHSDHVGDAARVARESNAPVVAMVELCRWLQRQGVRRVEPMNLGGTITVAGLRVTLVEAQHSSACLDDESPIYLGAPSGFILTLEDGRVIYFAGDTDVFEGMRLIRELYHPEIAFLPIGDRFTMGPRGAALA
ncbi:uncharacterized protein METZ01_LOCUS341057, partial [marine metagenome]